MCGEGEGHVWQAVPCHFIGAVTNPAWKCPIRCMNGFFSFPQGCLPGIRSLLKFAFTPKYQALYGSHWFALFVSVLLRPAFPFPCSLGYWSYGTDSSQPCTPPAPLEAAVKPGSFCPSPCLFFSWVKENWQYWPDLAMQYWRRNLAIALQAHSSIISSENINSIQLMLSIKILTPEWIKEVSQKPFTGSSKRSWILTVSQSGFRTRHRIETVLILSQSNLRSPN